MVVGLLCAAAWMQSNDGGISARLDSLVHRGRDAVAGMTEDASLRDAALALDKRFDRDGAYPIVTEALLRDDPDLTWGVGVDVSWCSSRAVVLTGLTGRGTISRLLVDGQVVDDVDGRPGCPADLGDPAPWSR